jgi:hypothetical protein
MATVLPQAPVTPKTRLSTLAGAPKPFIVVPPSPNADPAPQGGLMPVFRIADAAWRYALTKTPLAHAGNYDDPYPPCPYSADANGYAQYLADVAAWNAAQARLTGDNRGGFATDWQVTRYASLSDPRYSIFATGDQNTVQFVKSSDSSYIFVRQKVANTMSRAFYYKLVPGYDVYVPLGWKEIPWDTRAGIHEWGWILTDAEMVLAAATCNYYAMAAQFAAMAGDTQDAQVISAGGKIAGLF